RIGTCCAARSRPTRKRRSCRASRASKMPPSSNRSPPAPSTTSISPRSLWSEAPCCYLPAMSQESFKEKYAKANQWGKGKLAFVDRPMIGSPGAPAQAETNASNIWGHLNAGYLIGYEYTRWWKESWALRNTAILGDWSWLNKT